MKVFTVEEKDIMNGAKVETFDLRTAEVKIPAIIVGEEGRGRKLGVLPVKLTPEKYQEWKEKGEVMIYEATLGKTKSGAYKLLPPGEGEERLDYFIGVFRTPIGFRGSNSYTGDKTGKWVVQFPLWKEKLKKFDTKKEAEQYQKETSLYVSEICPEYFPWPGENLVEGIIAQGIAGYMGSGKQLVSLLPKEVVFRIEVGGRRYGAPHEYFYKYNGERFFAVTKEERRILEDF